MENKQKQKQLESRQNISSLPSEKAKVKLILPPIKNLNDAQVEDVKKKKRRNSMDVDPQPSNTIEPHNRNSTKSSKKGMLKQ